MSSSHQDLQRLAQRYLLACILSGIASLALFIPAFGMHGEGPYGLGAIVLAGCCIYFNYRRRQVEQKIEQQH